VAVEVETLKAFRDRVNGLLTSLGASAGSTKSITAQVLEPGHPGTGFAEVDALLSRYQETHAKLQQLSRTLSDTIDAMTISIDCSRLGYENVDADQVARLWRIHNEAEQASQNSGVTQTSADAQTMTNGNGETSRRAL
jgi:hypothetical protein